MVGLAVLNILESFSNRARDSCCPDSYRAMIASCCVFPLIQSMVRKMKTSVYGQFPVNPNVDTECDPTDAEICKEF